ncbi:MAG TPA: hypothetical protein VGN34_13600, partial [Ktedonobacteraceae bacterium]
MTHAAASPFSIPRRFFRSFEQERLTLLSTISGLPTPEACSHYSSLLFRRLMVLYFLQTHGLLAQNPHYLPQQLLTIRTNLGSDKFFHTCLLPLFQTLASSAHLAGPIPTLALPLFALNSYETEFSALAIPDHSFERLFAFFGTFHWSLSSPSPRSTRILGPDILASLFEQQVDQKQTGAYYTRADVTRYTATNTIIPYLLTRLEQCMPTFFSSPGSLLSLLQASPDRYIQGALRSPDYLPLETEQDFQARQARYSSLLTRLQQGQCASVAALIDANLDLQQLLLDTINTAHDPAIVLQLYSLLSQITILDPTCGPGAFLLAALSLLQPLYAACLTRFGVLLQSPATLSSEQQIACETFLSAAGAAPNRSFFILEQIINHNLYGVDIMDEAVEICQICLFLLLLSSVQRPEDLCPFSHFSFHIRTGNALVGFVHPPTLPDCTLFAQESSTSAVQCRSLDSLLARTHGLLCESTTDSADYLEHLTQWRIRYRPFHWCLEFQSCMQQGGFSVIIGNPPFVEYHQTQYGSLFSGYQTQGRGNLYALVIERALALCREEHSFLGLLVPLSICGADRFSPLRRLLVSRSAQLWLANFAIFPCRLFEGAFQRLSLIFAQCATNSHCQLATTKIQRWYSAERPTLLPLITYTPATISRPLTLMSFPKLASPLQVRILAKAFTRTQENTLATLLSSSSTPHFVYYQEATNYWTKASCLVPFYKKNGVVMPPAHGRFLFFSEQTTAQAIMALLNSSLFYLWFATYADGFHLAHALVKSFPICYDRS